LGGLLGKFYENDAASQVGRDPLTGSSVKHQCSRAAALCTYFKLHQEPSALLGEFRVKPLVRIIRDMADVNNHLNECLQLLFCMVRTFEVFTKLYSIAMYM
jgi:hypothetical protein